jgi:hypothetical protein
MEPQPDDMETTQIIYPTQRLLANPKIFMAIARVLDGPDWETLANAFYELIELQVLEAESEEEAVFGDPEVCFRIKPEDERVVQVILQSGNAIELHPSDEDGEEEYYAAVRTEEDFAITSTINARLIRAIEEAAPEVAGDVALCEPPTPANEFLRDPRNDCFSGRFHLMSDPEQLYEFRVEIVDLHTDELRASIRRL